jgi:hypothetical protein
MAINTLHTIAVTSEMSLVTGDHEKVPRYALDLLPSKGGSSCELPLFLITAIDGTPYTDAL